MALLKEIKNDLDIPVKYWKIISIIYRYTDQPQTSIQLLGYLDEEGRDKNNLIETQTYTFEEIIQGLNQNSAYNRLKTLSDFEGAKDI